MGVMTPTSANTGATSMTLILSHASNTALFGHVFVTTTDVIFEAFSLSMASPENRPGGVVCVNVRTMGAEGCGRLGA